MLRHVDPTLCERSDRCRVGPHPPTLAAGGTHGAPTPALAAHDPQRHLLPAAHRRRLALPGAGMAALADGVRLLEEVAAEWDLEADPHRPARAAPPPVGPRSATQCRQH